MDRKRILVVSDSHRRSDNIQKIIEKNGPVDMLIHLGDIEDDTEKIKEWAGCPCYFVCGNCDYDFKLQNCQIINLGPHRIFAVHGHKYAVHSDTLRLELAAKEMHSDIALFGHTHVPYLYEGSDITILNPGSCSQPRQYDGRKTYAIMEMDENGRMSYEICNL